MKLHSLVLASALLASSSAFAQSVQITGFGTNDGFVQAAPFGTDSQDATSYTISGSDLGSTLVGQLTTPFSLALTGLATPDLFLTATLTFTANPASDFQIGLYDEDGDALLYNANWSSFTTSNEPITLTLTYASTDFGGSGAFSGQVHNFVLATNGAGATVNLKLDNLAAAIPEPSSFAAIAGLGILGAVVSRRRRSA